MQWIVYRHNINSDKIEPWNVFDHGGFLNDITNNFKRNKTNKIKFEEELRLDLFYHYGHKAEWEVLIIPWCGGQNTKPVKVCVYMQVMNNWDLFSEYVWSSLSKI